MEKLRMLNENWSKIVCSGRQMVRKAGEFEIKTREKEVCPGSLR